MFFKVGSGDPQGFLKQVPWGSQQKGESFILTIVQSIMTTMKEIMTIFVINLLSIIKHLKAKILLNGGPWDKILSNVSLWSNLCQLGGPWRETQYKAIIYKEKVYIYKSSILIKRSMYPVW